jgi:hypothetical protein
MSILISEETTLRLADVPKHVPTRRAGKKLHVATAFRWAKTGVRGVKLETIRIGGTLCTSVEALQRFFERLSATDTEQPAHAVDGIRSTSRRQRDIAAAQRKLAARGIPSA